MSGGRKLSLNRLGNITRDFYCGVLHIACIEYPHTKEKRCHRTAYVCSQGKIYIPLASHKGGFCICQAAQTAFKQLVGAKISVAHSLSVRQSKGQRRTDLFPRQRAKHLTARPVAVGNAASGEHELISSRHHYSQRQAGVACQLETVYVFFVGGAGGCDNPAVQACLPHSLSVKHNGKHKKTPRQILCRGVDFYEWIILFFDCTFRATASDRAR